MLRVNISNIIRDNYKQYTGKPHGQFELQLDYSAEYDERYPENNLDTILTDNPLNDSMIEEIKAFQE